MSGKRTTGTLSLVVLPLLVMAVAAIAIDAAEPAGAAGVALASDWFLYPAYAVWALHIARRQGLDFAPLKAVPQSRATWLWTLTSVPLLVIAAAVMYLGAVVLSFWFPSLHETLLEPYEVGDGRGLAYAVVQGITAATIVPLTEEIVFRGVLLRLWIRRYGVRVAIVGSSALFGVLHGGDFIGGFFFGVVMAWLFLASRSLALPVATHALHNAIVGVARLFPDSADTSTIAEFRADWLEALLALILTLAVVAVLLRITVRRKPAIAQVWSDGMTPR